MIMDLFIIGAFKLLAFGSGCVPILVLDFLFSMVLMYFLNNWINQVDGPEEAKGIMFGAALYISAIILLPVMLLTASTFRIYLGKKL